ncbi:Tripartite tricarboxylate transporter family receptor [compost metagenome]
MLAWDALYVPRGTPPAIAQKLNATLATILAQQEVRQRLLDLGHEPAGGSASELASFAKSERQKWGPLIAHIGLKAD